MSPALATVPLRTGDKTVPFAFPATPFMKELVTEIFAGRTYPGIDFLADRVDLVLDIGANIGAAAVFLSLAYPQARVAAYEPAAEPFALLETNAGPHPRIAVRKAAVSDRDGEATLHLGSEGSQTNSMVASFMTTVATETVPTVRAADVFRKEADQASCIVLKVDTEGCERPIFRDLEPLLARIAVVYLEYHAEADRQAIDRMLTGAGFLLFAGHSPHPHRGDLCFVRKALVDRYSRFGEYDLAAK